MSDIIDFKTKQEKSREEYAKQADENWACYQAHITRGFSHEQAFQIVLQLLGPIEFIE
jgi:hypothetical protein